ncbi:ABC transporter ATP-binding protein [Desulfobulbus sp.]|uniref:ABC transporter ATP-binding protein n=1 Tax=Desulfobulbus sp. TaxID=895 RepID=UPI00286F315E|nr:ABC transporter ATP-binding protein [Desulfobulbus sp.]
MAPVSAETKKAMLLAGLAALANVFALVLLAAAVSALMNNPAKILGISFSPTTGVLLLGTVTVFAFVCRNAAFRTSHLGAFRLEQILRTRLSAHLAEVPLGFVVASGSGTLKKVLLDDVRNLHAFVADSTPFIGRSMAAPAASLVMLMLVDWRLAATSVALLCFGALLMYFVMRDSVSHRQEYAQSQERINAAVIEFVQAMPVVRTFDDGSGSFRRFQEALAGYRLALKKWIAATGVSARLGMLILSPVPTLVAVAGVGTLLLARGSLDFPALIAALLLSTGMADALMPLMWLNNFIKKSQASALRIQEILNVPVLPKTSVPQQPKDASVLFDRVWFRYENRREDALKDVSFIASPGTVTALVGPSGAGKSTVAKLIPRFWDVTAGRIRVGGTDIRDMLPETLMATVSFVFQDTFLFQDSIEANIRMARPEASFEQVVAAAEAARIHDFILTLPDGYQTRAGDRGTRLSGGQRQRITIARAILRDAPVVILDEATAFADPENEEEIIEALANLMRNRTVIVIAHRLATIKDVDQIVVFDQGEVAEIGTHGQLVDQEGVYKRLWRNFETAQQWDLKQGEVRA